MSYTPSTDTPLIFAYSTTNQSFTSDARVKMHSTMYNGTLDSNDEILTDTERCSLIGDVKYNMSTNHRRCYTALRRDGTETPARGTQQDGRSNAAAGVSCELTYATFNAGDFDMFMDQRTTSTITLQSEYSRMTGVRLS